MEEEKREVKNNFFLMYKNISYRVREFEAAVEEEKREERRREAAKREASTLNRKLLSTQQILFTRGEDVGGMIGFR